MMKKLCLFFCLFSFIVTHAQSHLEYYKVYQEKGRDFILQGKYDSAIVAFDQGLAMMPYSHAMYYEKGYAAMQSKDYLLAISSFSTLLEKASYKYKARYNRAVCYFELGNLWAAKQDLEYILSSDANNLEAQDLLMVIQGIEQNQEEDTTLHEQQSQIESILIRRRSTNEQLIWGTVIPMVFWTTIFLTW